MATVLEGALRCADDRRSAVLRAPSHPLNGVDFVEYVRAPLAPPGQRFMLAVTFLKPPPALVAGDFAVIGGVRIVGIRVLGTTPDPADPLTLRVFVDQEGDFSFYALHCANPAIDSQRAEARFSFKAGCPSPLDCRVVDDCTRPALPEPELDYLAKDYQSFRRLMLDLIAQRNPGWQERLSADLGVTLVELFAYAGDLLSYAQDAAGTEAFLDTCLHRTSGRRHGRLIDYTMHNGRNAVSAVHFAAVPGTSGVVPAGAKLTTRIGTALAGAAAPPGPVLPIIADFDSDSALSTAIVFETASLVQVTDRHNALRIHTWDDTLCCMGAGANEAWLFGIDAGLAFAPALAVGDYLLLEEVLSPVTGAAADRNPAHRQVVRLTLAEIAQDDAFTDAVPAGVLTPRAAAADPMLPLLHVQWAVPLGFPLCLSAQTATGMPIGPVALARGNVTLCDHGRTVTRHSDRGEIALPSPGTGRWPLPTLALPDAPLTHQAMPATPEFDASGRLLFGRHDLDVSADRVAPAVVLLLREPGGADEIWSPVPHLLDSLPADQSLVAEIDNAGQAVLRFGDDAYGRRPLGLTGVQARYRVGNGQAGNLGAEALRHVVTPDPADPLDPADPAAPLVFAAIDAVYQPLAARLGQEPQSVEQVRQWAPEAFRAVQFRAVTEADWAAAALTLPAVAAAKARLRWTGSWYTVFVALQPVNPGNLLRLPGGGVALTPGFAASMLMALTRWKIAGYELAVLAAVYVPLDVEITLCVRAGHSRGDVLGAAGVVLRGFFNPLNFGFGEPVYLSRLYAALATVEGLESANATVFHRYWETQRDELARGVITMGEMEIPRLDNDAGLPENGVLRLTAVGGR